MNSVVLRLFPLILFFLYGCASNTPAPVVDRSISNGTKATAQVSVERVAAKGYYIVKEGDTLYRIALDHGQDYRELATWNQLENPNLIRLGQELRVAPLEGEMQPIARPIGLAPIVEKRPLDGNNDNLRKEPKAGREPYSDDVYTKEVKQVAVIQRVDVKPEQKPEIKPEIKADPKPNDDDVQWAWPVNGKILGHFVENTSKGIDFAGKTGDPVITAAEGKVVYSGTGLRGYGQLVIVKHNANFLTAYAHNSKILVKEGQAVTKGQKIAEMGDTDADRVKLHFEVRRLGKPVDPLKYLPSR